MIKERHILWEENENTYKNGRYQIQYVDSFIHEDEEYRPGIYIIPGGGYTHVSPREADNVAERFYEMGYQAFVLMYTVDEFSRVPLKLQPLRDASRGLRLIRSKADEFKIFKNKVAVCGFSAGGHLAAALCLHHGDIEDDKYGDFSNRPDAAILCYPVISAGNHAHRGSFDTLLGDMATMDEIKYMSLEKQVTADMVPSFIWTTAGDESVPIENSMLFAMALREKKVPYALHIFSEGRHGRNLGYATDTEPAINEIMVWPELADRFVSRYMLQS